MNRRNLAIVFILLSIPLFVLVMATIAVMGSIYPVLAIGIWLFYIVGVRLAFVCRKCGTSLFTRGSEYVIAPWPKRRCDCCGSDIATQA